MFFHCILASIILMENQPLIILFPCTELFFHHCFQDFFLSFSNLTMCLVMVLFVLILLGIENFGSVDNKLGKFGTIISLDNLMPHSVFCPSGAPMTCMLVPQALSHRSLMLCSFSIPFFLLFGDHLQRRTFELSHSLPCHLEP